MTSDRKSCFRDNEPRRMFVRVQMHRLCSLWKCSYSYSQRGYQLVLSLNACHALLFLLCSNSHCPPPADTQASLRQCTAKCSEKLECLGIFVWKTSKGADRCRGLTALGLDDAPEGKVNKITIDYYIINNIIKYIYEDIIFYL